MHPGNTRRESQLVDPPLCGGLDAQAMRGRLATRLFGTDAGDVSIGRFQIVERIGAGGMGVVYLASDPKLGRRVALKLLHPKAVASEEDRLRLLREARALAKLSHPNVVQLYEVGEYKGSVFLAMEYVHGVPLSDWQSETDHTWRETLEPYLQAAKGLAAAHAAGLVHRDFKPANAIVGEDGRVRVADFGLARGPGLSSQESSDVGSSEASRSGVDSTITRPGSVVGTPAYMSPEQFTGDPVSASSDQFSYCVALWEALTGERPYSVTALRMGADAALPKEHGGAAYPRWLDALLRRGLALTPGDRFADMDALLAALQRGLRPRTAVRSAVAVAGLVVLALGAQLLMTREVGCANEPTLMDVWDAARRERAKAGVATTGDDGPVWWRIERGLDQYSAQWRTRVDALCTAEQGLAPLMGWRRCLERSKRQLNYSIGLLDSGDRVAVADFAKMLGALPDPLVCTQTLPAPDEAVGASAQEQLDQARVLLELGRPRAAQTAVQRPDVAAAAAASPSFAAVLAWIEGDARRELGDIDGAAERLEASATLAMREGDDAQAAIAFRGLAEIDSTDREDFASAKRWLRISEASAIRGDVGASERVKRALVSARIAGRSKHLEDARAVIEAVLDDARALPERDALLLGRVLRTRGDTLVALEAFEAAEVAFTEARTFHVRAFGEGHVETASVDFSIGLMARAQDDYAKALPIFERTLVVRETAYGEASPRVARSLTAAAEALINTGDVERALTYARRAWDVQRDGLPKGHSDRGGALHLLAQLERATGHAEQAVELQKELATEWESGANQAKLPMVLSNIGYGLCALQRCDDSYPYYVWLARLVEPGTFLGLVARFGQLRATPKMLPAAEALSIVREIRRRHERLPTQVQRADFQALLVAEEARLVERLQ